jgi:hypothetical protein
MTVPFVPETPIVALYDHLHCPGFGRASRLARAREFVKHPPELAAMFEASVALMHQFVPRDEAFYPPRPEHDASTGIVPPTLDVALRLRAQSPFQPAASVEAQSAAEDAALPDGVSSVRVEDLCFSYLDRELVPSRTTGERDLRGTKVRLDLLLRSDPDRVPVVCEVKVGGDKDAFAALVQALACTAQLATPAQYTRLAKYGCAGKQADIATATGPTFDIVVLLHNPPTGTYLPELRAETRHLAALLLGQPGVATTVRRIVGLTSRDAPDGDLAIELDYGYARE